MARCEFCEQSGLRSLQGDLHVAGVIWKVAGGGLRIVGGLAGLQMGVYLTHRGGVVHLEHRGGGTP